MARKPRPRKRCKKSKARRVVIRKKIEQLSKIDPNKSQPNLEVSLVNESSESIFDRLLEEHRRLDKNVGLSKQGNKVEKMDVSVNEEVSLILNDWSDSTDTRNNILEHKEAVDEVCQLDSSVNSDEDFPELLVEQCPPEDLAITGRRVVDINHMLKQLQKLSNHHKKCTMGEYKFNREVVSGFYSKFIYYCDNCETEEVITSEPQDERQEVNDAAVWGALSIGVGHNQIQELFGLMNIPVMSPKKYKFHEKKIGKVWEETLLKKMKENAEEERRIAMEKNNYLNGVPFITVIGDGGWAKRSYGHGLNSLSGVGVIIGAETKKLLYIGVRNKFCYVCAKHKNKNAEPPTHECFLNFHGPSTAMESDIIVDGFKRSEEDYGLIYKFYIGDGDSSVFAHIQEKCRYGRYVKKIECANHVTRALNDQLHKVASNTAFPLESRKLLSSAAEGETIPRLERIVKGVRTAIKDSGTTRSNSDVANLRHNIKNCIDHVFGNHQQCRGTFCKRKGEESLLHLLDSAFLSELRKLLGRVESKAESLVHNETTNRAEHYMSLLAKFTGGKRLNLTSRGSYRLRCFGAGLSHSTGPSWHLSPLKRLTMKSPGGVTKSFILSREKVRSKRRLLYSQKGVPKKKTRHGTYDTEYGPLAIEPDLDDETLDKRKQEVLEKLAADDPDTTERETVGQHSNLAWQEKRMNRLTASKFGVVAKRLPHTSCHNLVKDILYPRELKTNSVLFGRAHEDVAIHQYEQATSNKVSKCGLFIYKDAPYLAASPDGLVGYDGLVEVKCLPSVVEDTLEERIKNVKKKDFCLEIRDNEIHLKKNHNYYFQIQGQLEIANRKWCDFVVYTRTAPLFIERIDRDCDFWRNKTFSKVSKFYLECLLPEIVDSRITRGLKARDAPYIINAKEKKAKNKNKKK